MHYDVNDGLIAFLQVEGEERPLKFSEVFHLAPTPEGSYFVFNNMFRLNYGMLTYCPCATMVLMRSSMLCIDRSHQLGVTSQNETLLFKLQAV